MAAGLCACDGRGGDPAPDPKPFVQGIEAAGLTGVRHAGLRRDGPNIVMTGVEAVTASGQAVTAREVRFEEIVSVSPLAAERVVASDVVAGPVKAGRVSLGRFSAAATPPFRGDVSAERVEGRLAGYPFAAASLSRETPQGGAIAVTFAGLSLDAPPLPAGAAWDGRADIATDPRDGATRLDVQATAKDTRLGLRMALAAPPPELNERSLMAWPLTDVQPVWGVAAVRDLSFRSEGLAMRVPSLDAAPQGGPGAAVAEGLAGGGPLALAYSASQAVPLEAWWKALASDDRVPGLSVRSGGKEVRAAPDAPGR